MSAARRLPTLRTVDDAGEVENIVFVLRVRGYLEEVEAMCRRMHVTVRQMASRSRQKSITRARREVWRWLYTVQRLSFPEIGDIFGRDHTSILAMIKGRKRKLEVETRDVVVDKIAAWIESKDAPEDDVRSFIDPVDLALIAAKIREGAWK